MDLLLIDGINTSGPAHSALTTQVFVIHLPLLANYGDKQRHKQEMALDLPSQEFCNMYPCHYRADRL